MELSATRNEEAAHPRQPEEASSALNLQLEAVERESGATALSLAVHDLETGLSVRHNADRWFHAASTIKLAVLLGIYSTIHQGRIEPQSWLHVRNRFFSAADGEAFRVLSERDANTDVHASIGRMMRIADLTRHMIATSSNLATNLLLDYIGIPPVRKCLDDLRIEGVDIRRGVEDDRAFEIGINNRVTADGLVALLRTIAEERALSARLSRSMLDVLHAQTFRDGIPARLPNSARVAHKTGEISTVAHDAGIVYLPDRRPYVIAVLTEWTHHDGAKRSSTIAEVSRAVFDFLAGDEGRKHE